jgi:hypothetical protein
MPSRDAPNATHPSGRRTKREQPQRHSLTPDGRPARVCKSLAACACEGRRALQVASRSWAPRSVRDGTGCRHQAEGWDTVAGFHAAAKGQPMFRRRQRSTSTHMESPTGATCSVAMIDSRNFMAGTAGAVSVVDFWAPWCGPAASLLPFSRKSPARSSSSHSPSEPSEEPNRRLARRRHESAQTIGTDALVRGASRQR